MQASPSGCSLFLLHPLLELVNASAGINQLLSASKERMALRADIYIKIRLNGASLEGFAASAFDNGLAEFGMNAVFHYYHLSWDVTRIPAKSLDTYVTPDSVVAQQIVLHL